MAESKILEGPAKMDPKGVQQPYPGKTEKSNYGGSPGASIESPAKPLFNNVGDAASLPIKSYPGSAADTKPGKPGAYLEGPCDEGYAGINRK